MTGKQRAGRKIAAPKEGVSIFVENVTIRYTFEAKDLPEKQQNHVH